MGYSKGTSTPIDAYRKIARTSRARVGNVPVASSMSDDMQNIRQRSGGVPVDREFRVAVGRKPAANKARVK